MIRTFAIAGFACPNCHKHVTECYDGIIVSPNGYQWTGTPFENDLPVECPFCKAVYSIHVKHVAALSWLAKLANHPDVKVTFEDASANGIWLALYPPDDPRAVWMDAYHRLGDIIAEYGIGGRGALPHSSDVINRMVFASTIGAMEAYLGDQLIRTVLPRPDALGRLLGGDNDLKKMAVSLSDVHANPSIVIDKTREHLASLLYHNLSKIAVLYSIAFGIDIFPNTDVRARLHSAVHKRHDIVHRNGKTKGGETLQLSTADVAQLLEDVNDFVTHIDNSIRAS